MSAIAEIVKQRVKKTEVGLNRIVNALPSHIRPSRYPKFDTCNHEDGSPLFGGWNYDWSDRGSNPPPWSDWSDVTKR